MTQNVTGILFLYDKSLKKIRIKQWWRKKERKIQSTTKWKMHNLHFKSVLKE